MNGVMDSVMLNGEHARLALSILSDEFQRLDEDRRRIPYPDDQPLIKRQNGIAAVMEAIRRQL